MFACFVDIGGIVDHHCLNFLFIILLYFFFIIISEMSTYLP